MPTDYSLMTLYLLIICFPVIFFFTNPPTTEIYTLSLHDALPIFAERWRRRAEDRAMAGSGRGSRRYYGEYKNGGDGARAHRSEEHTSELQSQSNLVCRLLLEKKKKKKKKTVNVYK